MRLAPSILSFNLSDLKGVLPQLDGLDPDVIHLDVMDGQFVPPISFGSSYVNSIREVSTSRFEAHLMTQTPERHFEAFAEAGCSRILFHAEATAHASRLAQQLRNMKVEAGLAINPATPVEVALALASELDSVLVMTVNPGWGGQRFLDFCLDKVRRIREEFPQLTIEVDGGIDPETIGKAHGAGADLFVVGSYLAKANDLTEAVLKLKQGIR
jgi:ribulose-phosphate 3-epimerase